MLNKKELPRIMTAKYLLVVPALAAALLAVQATGLQVSETNSTNVIDESPVWADVAHWQYPDTEKQAVEPLPNIVQIRKEKGSSDPLIVVDGKIIPNEEMNKIDPKTIQSIDILKDKSAVELYGEKGANGVIIIKLKTGTNTDGQKESVQDEAVMAYQPKDNVEVKIRSVEGLQGARPLYVVDGKEVDSLGNLTRADIESISVLKDASANTVYGKKGKNGVVIIITKK